MNGLLPEWVIHASTLCGAIMNNYSEVRQLNKYVPAHDPPATMPSLQNLLHRPIYKYRLFTLKEGYKMLMA